MKFIVQAGALHLLWLISGPAYAEECATQIGMCRIEELNCAPDCYHWSDLADDYVQIEGQEVLFDCGPGNRVAYLYVDVPTGDRTTYYEERFGEDGDMIGRYVVYSDGSICCGEFYASEVTYGYDGECLNPTPYGATAAEPEENCGCGESGAAILFGPLMMWMRRARRRR